MAKIDNFFKFMVDNECSDLHMNSGCIPMLRRHGDIVPMKFQTLTPDLNKSLLYEILKPEQVNQYESTGDLDFAYEVLGLARFRGNIFNQRLGISAVFRSIPSTVLTADQLNLPTGVRNFANLHKGLVLVTGPTGSGKSTTLAAIIDLVNDSRQAHILTVEDPIEFVHANKKSLISQREVHNHTQSFATALKASLREDPDVILVGEMRDLETIELAITAAETGHLVFGTLHTNSAPKTIDRIINVFPVNQQAQIRIMLSESLQGVVSQLLLKKIGGGRCAAQEIMICTTALSNMIRESKTYQLKSAMQTTKSLGNQTMEQALADLVLQKKITLEDALAHAEDTKFVQSYVQNKQGMGAMGGSH
ncbi:MAG: type IV pilus twitching motility protein PilT [Acidobacteria bacterium]|nr:type IV pilus twitching motility protein PilT [Acidobacteriota bacterium]MCB9399473.1 type IV pilus twitching motility protein PilT [Acidobacteriota bacterium]